MPDKLVSVIIAVYNGERYLAEAIRSVFAQTYCPLELIVIDDGSIDASATIAKSFELVRYAHQQNAGQSVALNRGLKMANGAFLAFLDADDFWTTDKLSLQMAALDSEPSLDMVFSHLEQFAEPDAPAALAAVVRKTRQVVPAQLPSTMLIRQSAFGRVGEFSSRWKIGNVVDWYARATEAGLRSRTLDQILYKRRIHGQNVGITQRQNRDDYLSIVKAALDRRRAAQGQNGSCNGRDQDNG